MPGTMDRCEDGIINAHTVMHDKIGAMCAGYGAFATRHSFLVLCMSAIFFGGLCIGFVAVTKETDLDSLWIETGTRVTPEKDFYEKWFGGLTRKQNVAIVDNTNPANVVTKANMAKWKSILSGFLTEAETFSTVNTVGTYGANVPLSVANANQVNLVSNIGSPDPSVPFTYTQKDFCETPSVPPVFSTPLPLASVSSAAAAGKGLLARMYSFLTRCLPNTIATQTMLPSNWGVDRFPCTRTVVLDCFRDGDFDYPLSLKMAQAAGPAVTGHFSAPTPIFTCLAAFQANLTNPDVLGPVFGTALGPTVAGLLAGGAKSVAFSAVQFFATLGYWYRLPVSSFADDDALQARLQSSLANGDNPAITFNQCLSPAVGCCLTWSGSKIGKQLFGGGISSSGLAATRMVSNCWNENHNTFKNKMLAKLGTQNTQSNRHDIILAWEGQIQSYLYPFWAKESSSGLDSGGSNPNMNLYFAPWRATDDTIKDGSSTEISLIIGAHIILIGYSMAVLGKFSCPYGIVNLVYSRTMVAGCGIMAVVFATISSFGVMGIIGVPLSPISVNLVPFLALGIGIDDMFVVSQFINLNNREEDITMRMKNSLRESIPAVLQTTLANVTSFFIASITPIRVVETFAIQMGFAILLNFISLLITLVPIIALDLKRTAAKRMDWVCCVAHPNVVKESDPSIATSGNVITNLTSLYIGPICAKWYVKVIFLACIYAFTAAMCWNGAVNIKKGLLLSDIALRGTFVRDYTDIQEQYFGAYDAYFVTKTVDYSNTGVQQRIYNTLTGLDASVWRSPEMSMFDLSWFARSASSYLGATNSTFGSLLTHYVPSNFFYAAFGSWVSGNGATRAPDIVCYSAITKGIVDCSSGWNSGTSKWDYNVTIAATRNTIYNRDLFTDTDRYISAMADNRAIADANSAGDGFMFGFIYQYYQQYVNVETNLYKVVGYSLLGVYGVALLFTFSPWGAAIMCVVILQIVVQLWGMLPFIDVKLNAFSVVNLSMTVGIAVEFTSYQVHTFLAAHGDRNTRMIKCMEQMMSPMLNGAMSTFLSVLVLIGARFPFFRKYFFGMFSLMCIIAFVNGMFALPILLSLVGPKPFHGKKETNEDGVGMNRLETNENATV